MKNAISKLFVLCPLALATQVALADYDITRSTTVSDSQGGKAYAEQSGVIDPTTEQSETHVQFENFSIHMDQGDEDSESTLVSGEVEAVSHHAFGNSTVNFSGQVQIVISGSYLEHVECHMDNTPEDSSDSTATQTDFDLFWEQIRMMVEEFYAQFNDEKLELVDDSIQATLAGMGLNVEEHNSNQDTPCIDNQGLERVSYEESIDVIFNDLTLVHSFEPPKMEEPHDDPTDHHRREADSTSGHNDEGHNDGEDHHQPVGDDAAHDDKFEDGTFEDDKENHEPENFGYSDGTVIVNGEEMSLEEAPGYVHMVIGKMEHLSHL